MGKYRFRLSDMMPNAWFYKLKDMGKSRSTSSKSRVSKSVKQSSPSPTAKQSTTKGSSITKFQHPTSSYVYYPSSASPAEPLIRFTDPLYSSPRNLGRASDARSSTSPCRKINKRTTIYQQKNENFSSFDQPFYYSLSSSELNSPEIMVSKTNDHSRKSIEFGPELLMFDELGSWSSPSLRSSCSCSCRISSSTADIIIDLNHHHHNNHEDSISRKFQKLNEFDALSELELRPILTKIPKEQNSDKIDTEVIKKYASKELLALGHNSYFFGKVNKSRRSSSLSDSFAIVKSSLDPQRDFQDSMMEMIEENNIRGFKDLEELLACYLSLNCKEYHPLIIKAFKQIWLDIFCCS